MKHAFPTTNKTYRRGLRLLLAGILFLLMTFSLGACDTLEERTGVEFERAANVQIGMVENSGLNSTHARFHTLSGRKTWREQLSSGDSLVLEYEAEIEKGSLTLKVESPEDEVIWETTLTEGEDAADQIEVNASENGTYTIAVIGDGAGGSYELAWDQVE